MKKINKENNNNQKLKKKEKHFPMMLRVKKH